jgi:hypothetical protein
MREQRPAIHQHRAHPRKRRPEPIEDREPVRVEIASVNDVAVREPRQPYSMRKMFCTALTEAEVSSAAQDWLMGHRTDSLKHLAYSAKRLPYLLSAIERIVLPAAVDVTAGTPSDGDMPDDTSAAGDVLVTTLVTDKTSPAPNSA